MPETLPLSPAIPDLGIPRVELCSAMNGRMICGATPTSIYHRTCGTFSHGSDIWLCPVHAAIVASGGAVCKECVRRGGVVPARIYRIIMIPVRLPKRYGEAQ